MQKIWQNVMISVGVACIPLGVFVALFGLVHAIAPALLWTVPLGVAWGFSVLWRRYPANAYPMALVYVPIVGGTLLWAALQISWYVVGNYI